MSLFVDLTEFICALSDDKHYVQEPILLTSCSHCACKNCLNIETKLKCKVCGVETKRNSRNDKVSRVVMDRIKCSLDKLFVELEEQTTSNIHMFKSGSFRSYFFHILKDFCFSRKH
jgi:hypothetical protein